MADVQEWDYLDDYEEGKDNRNLKPVPSHTTVFEITGPMFSLPPTRFWKCLFMKKRR